MKPRLLLMEHFRWEAADQLSDSTCDILIQAARAADAWLKSSVYQDDLTHRLTKVIGGVNWKPSPFIWRCLGFHHVEFNTVFIDPLAITCSSAVHEFAHVLDNTLGVHPLSTFFGGGPSDEMARFLGYDPDQFFPRFHAAGFEEALQKLNIEHNPTDYGRMWGPAEDFADAFRLAVTDPHYLEQHASQRYAWFQEWRKTLLDLI